MFEWNQIEAAGHARQPVGNFALGPGMVAAGGPAFVLTVTGTGFTGTAVIQWAGPPAFS